MPVSLNVVFSANGPYLTKGEQAGTPELDVDALEKFLSDTTITEGAVAVKDIKPAVPEKYVRFSALSKEFLDHIVDISTYFASKCSDDTQYKEALVYRKNVEQKGLRYAMFMRDALVGLTDDLIKRLSDELDELKASVPAIKAEVDRMCVSAAPISSTKRLINVATKMTDFAWAALHIAYVTSQTLASYLSRAFMGTARYWYAWWIQNVQANTYFTVAAAAVVAPDFVKETFGVLSNAWAWFIQWGYSIRQHGIKKGTEIHFDNTRWWLDVIFKSLLLIMPIAAAMAWIYLIHPRIQAGIDLFNQGGPRPGGGGGGGPGGFSGMVPYSGSSRRLTTFRWMDFSPAEIAYIQSSSTLPVVYKAPSANEIVDAVKAVEDPQAQPDPTLDMPATWTQEAKELLLDKGLMVCFLMNVVLAVGAGTTGGAGALVVHAFRKGATAWMLSAANRVAQRAWLSSRPQTLLEDITQKAASVALGKTQPDADNVHPIFKAISWTARQVAAVMVDAAVLVVPLLLPAGAAPQGAVVPANYFVSREVRDLLAGNDRWGVGGAVTL